MKYLSSSSQWAKKICVLAVAGAIALPSLTVAPQESLAQVRGSQNRGSWGWGNNGEWGDGSWNNVGQTTITGVVTRDTDNNRTFQIRTTDNRYYRVRVPNGQPTNVSVGDRVQIRGRVRNNNGNNNTIRADEVRVLRESDDRPGYNQRIEFDGTVVSILSNRRFTVRRDRGYDYANGGNVGDNVYTPQGRRAGQSGQWGVYTVDINRDIRNLIRTGDRIHVEAYTVTSQTLRAIDIDKIGGSGGGYETGNVNFEGRVTQIYDRKHVQARSVNGRTYDVRTWANISGSINVGDLVRISGRADGSGRVTGGSISLVSNNGGYPGTGQRVDFSGTVLSDTRLNNNFSVRGDNGRIYTVRYVRSTFRNGERVRIVGEYSGNIIIAEDINRL
jgi:translation initiation factor IF-1